MFTWLAARASYANGAALLRGRPAATLEIWADYATDRDSCRNRARFDQHKTAATSPGRRWLLQGHRIWRMRRRRCRERSGPANRVRELAASIPAHALSLPVLSTRLLLKEVA